ncbi:MAG: outer membrane protein assembly factor BamD [Bacteroidetes bacterium]|uniref:Outer membrane protein assembly factor BamD n=1 Tax=Candidatus Cryptobacteroides gallistercoris TaxID=2840765 RepID=A0A940DP93_9BACT|nr:outer membrane protein assembly factor BamD [Candidatus Cryptobacteroides gallistercoris]
MKLKIIAAAAAAAAAALSLSSCKSQYEMLLNSNDVDLKYEAAFRYFNDAKFTKAADLFESISVLTGGTERDDTVQYYWGLSNYRAKDYYTAETNFEKFLESYPRSPFSAEARFLRLDCMYRSTLRYELDQAPTYRAIDAISQFMSEYPDASHADVCREMLNDLNARLDTKAFEAARLYYKMEDYIASRVSFRNVLKDDSENIYREDILYYIAMSSYKYAQLSVLQKQKERYMTFVDDYLNFIGEYPESEYRRELDTIYRRVQRILGRYPGQQAVEADMEEHDDRAFEKERRRLNREQKAIMRKGARLNEKFVDDTEDMVILRGMENESEAKSENF